MHYYGCLHFVVQLFVCVPFFLLLRLVICSNDVVVLILGKSLFFASAAAALNGRNSKSTGPFRKLDSSIKSSLHVDNDGNI
jgi:hypothetical protein